MIVYLDASAFVPLLVAEPSSPACRRWWDDADVVVSSRLLYAEAGAALAQARRQERLTAQAHRATPKALDELWSQLDVAEIDQSLVERAAAVAYRFQLPGHGAVHCASAERFADADLVAAAGDRQLLRAWSRLGLTAFDSFADVGG